jgi:hypothetical protein
MAAAELHAHAPTPWVSEAELAAMRAGEGDAVFLRRGCWWRSAYPGFYQPVDLLTRVRAADVRQPMRACWGFRAALRDEDTALANASIPVHVLPDLPHFDLARLSRNRRSDLRKCRRRVEIRRLETHALLLEQGYAVFRSAVERLGRCRPLTEREYRQRLLRRAAHGHRLFIAGFIDGKLCGYLDSHATSGVLHTDEIFVATGALRSGVGTGLYVETLLAAACDPELGAVCNGVHRPEAPALCHFKASLGFRVVHLPARVAIAAPMRRYLRARRPATYYRLTGDPTALAAVGADASAGCAGWDIGVGASE